MIYIIRIIFFVLLLVGATSHPLLFFAVGGVLFGIFFPIPLEVIGGAIITEAAAGIPLGFISIPLISAYIATHATKYRLLSESALSFTLLFIGGLIVFMGVQGILTYIWFQSTTPFFYPLTSL